MAEKLQAQKLAAARRMLKEYKRKTLPNRKSSKQNITEETNETVEKTPGNVTPAESLASSTQSAVDAAPEHPESANYFNKSLFESGDANLLSNYFDNLPANTNVQDAFAENQNGAETSECALTQTEVDNQNVYSNTESLRQLSSQINSLISSEPGQQNGELHELERRNQELVASLAQEKLRTEQLSVQAREYTTRIAQLEAEVQQVRNEQEAKLSRELGSLQDQLQYHIQTVGILVGEKTELSMALAQSQNVAKQKTSECEEFQNRLKASKYRVAELEKEVSNLSSVRENLSKHDQDHSRQLEKLSLDYNLLKEQQHALSEECAELRDKLNAKLEESVSLQRELQEKASQLSLAQLKIEQLTSADSVHAESQIEALNQQKLSLEQQVNELNQTVKAMSSERAQANQQYQQYVQQLNAQIQTLAETLTAKTEENEALAQREQSLLTHVGELERLMQELQAESEANAARRAADALHHVEAEKAELESRCRDALERVDKLQAELEEKKNSLAELEDKLERLSEQPDATKLLAAMESDKVAASRAVEQNLKLKDQLEELHEGFIKISDSKLKLTEDLQAEQHKCRELTEKIGQASSAIDHLHSVIAAKDKQFMELQQLSEELQKKVLQQEQLSDRLRHYEAQGTVAEYVQQELQQLKTENEQLKQQLAAAQLAGAPPADAQAHAAELKDIIEKLEQSNLELMEKINSGQTVQPEEPCLDKEKAMEKLEERFKKNMAEIANLTEEKQRLEHLVLQLQSETETIGEYVTLYQCQRAMLREKALEKDEQLKRLARDREEMRLKLEELHGLIRKLVVEKELIPSDVLHHKLHGVAGDCQLKASEAPAPEPALNGTAHDNNNDNTAGKIISLLSEIKTSNLVQPSDSIQNFHPCPWCSGQLLNV